MFTRRAAPVAPAARCARAFHTAEAQLCLDSPWTEDSCRTHGGPACPVLLRQADTRVEQRCGFGRPSQVCTKCWLTRLLWCVRSALIPNFKRPRSIRQREPKPLMCDLVKWTSCYCGSTCISASFTGWTGTAAMIEVKEAGQGGRSSLDVSQEGGKLLKSNKLKLIQIQHSTLVKPSELSDLIKYQNKRDYVFVEQRRAPDTESVNV